MKYMLIFALALSFNGFSQQDPLTGFYWNNYSYYNPAMNGVEFKHEANVVFRNQWDQVSGSPLTLFANYGINLADKHGIGVNYSRESTGASDMDEVKLNYNYQLNLGDERKIVFGTGIGYQDIHWMPTWNAPVTQNDPGLPSANHQNVHLDVGTAYYGEKLMAGISATRLPLYSTSDFISSAVHMYGNLRYTLQLSDNEVLIGETQLRTDFVKYSQDIGLRYSWKNLVEAGVGYRTSDAVLFNLTGIIKKNYRVGYQYEMTINKLSSISRGTHEIAVSLRLPN